MCGGTQDDSGCENGGSQDSIVFASRVLHDSNVCMFGRSHRIVEVVKMDNIRIIVVLHVQRLRKLLVVHVKGPRNDSSCACDEVVAVVPEMAVVLMVAALTEHCPRMKFFQTQKCLTLKK